MGIFKHGMKGTREYNTWQNMKRRCNNPKEISYKNYGGRGIKVCDRWQESFVNFYKDMGESPKGLTIERIDNNGNYEPSNCKWATREEQQWNKRTTIRDEYWGIKYISYDKIFRKRKKIAGKCQWCGEDAVTIFCEKHREVYNRQRREQRANRIRNGKCMQCGKDTKSGTRCEYHRIKSNNRRNKIATERKKRNKCAECGKDTIKGTRCEYHRLKHNKNYIFNR